MESVKCDFCGSRDSNLIGVFNDNMFDIPGEFSYVRCTNCGLIYLQNRPDEQEISEFYPADYQPYRKAIQDEKNAIMRWARWRNIRQYCQYIERNSRNRPGRILDVGCSTGIFIDAMRQAGWQTKGVEISSSAAGYARSRLNLDVELGHLLNLQFEEESFDAISFWNVFEHLHQPRKNLDYVHKLLRKGGIVAMVFPNWESVDRRLFGKAWIGYDAPRHLFIYPASVIQEVMEASGFKIIYFKSGPNNYYSFVTSLHSWLRLKFSNRKLANLIAGIFNFPGVRFIFQPVISILDLLGKSGTSCLIAVKK